MKSLRVLALVVASAALAAMGFVFADENQAPPEGDYIEHFDTLYNSLTLERRGSVVEMRARSRRGQFIESAVDLADPLRLVVAYTRTLYGAAFLQPAPNRVVMIGLGGGGFHRLFAVAYPDAELHTVELDAKVLELSRTHMGFVPTERMPVTILDGRLFVKRNRDTWDWIILDAFRGGYVPPHLKTVEFYRECAARLDSRGVLVCNLHRGTQLFFSDLRTLREVFPQIVLLQTANRGNVIALAVNYREPDLSDPARWTPVASLQSRFADRLDCEALLAEHIPFPEREVSRADLLTDDFAPVEFLDTVEANNTAAER